MRDGVRAVVHPLSGTSGGYVAVRSLPRLRTPPPGLTATRENIKENARFFETCESVYVARVYFAQIKNPGNIKLADFGSTFIYSYYKLDVLKIPE